MKRHIVLIILLVAVITVPAWSITVKLGSPFPEGSPWDNTLKQMAAEWAEISNGQVRMRIYPGGVAGNEADMIRKMRFGQLDSAVLTAFGLKIIVPDTFVFTLPGLLQSEAELDYTLEEVAPRFDQDFIDEGFRVLAWSKSGWANFFATSPIYTPEDLRAQRLAVNSTEEEIAANFKALRFNVIPVNLSELVVSLQSGMVNAFYAPPMAAAAYQSFAMAPNMMDFPIAPVLGGLVISERTWNRIPERYRADLQAAIQDVASQFFDEAVRLNDQAMRVMDEYGLTVQTLNDQQQEEWFDVLMEGHELVVGEDSWISPLVYENLITELEEFRGNQ